MAVCDSDTDRVEICSDRPNNMGRSGGLYCGACKMFLDGKGKYEIFFQKFGTYHIFIYFCGVKLLNVINNQYET